jgi:hypothetical protein
VTVSPVPHNKQLQRTVEQHRGDAARAPFHYARASRSKRQRAAAELRRYAEYSSTSFLADKERLVMR